MRTHQKYAQKANYRHVQLCWLLLEFFDHFNLFCRCHLLKKKKQCNIFSHVWQNIINVTNESSKYMNFWSSNSRNLLKETILLFFVLNNSFLSTYPMDSCSLCFLGNGILEFKTLWPLGVWLGESAGLHIFWDFFSAKEKSLNNINWLHIYLLVNKRNAFHNFESYEAESIWITYLIHCHHCFSCTLHSCRDWSACI